MLAALCLTTIIATTEPTATFEHHPFLYPDVLVVRFRGEPPAAARSLQSPMLARNRYWHTGDREAAQADLAALNAFFKRLAQYKTDTGLLNLPRDLWQAPWPPSLAADLGRTAPAATADPLVNAFYIRALQTTGFLARDLDASPAPYEKAAERAGNAYAQFFGPALRGAGEAPAVSNADRAVALAFGLVPDADSRAVLQRLGAGELPADPYLASFAIDAALQAGDPPLAMAWIERDAGSAWRSLLEAGGANTLPIPPVEPSSPVYLVADRVFGLSPATPGWKRVNYLAALALPKGPFAVPVPGGRVSVRPHPISGATLTVPPDVTVASTHAEAKTAHAMSHARANVTDAQQQLLAQHDWAKWTGDRPIVWVSIAEQMLRVIQNNELIYQAQCATAAKGIGNRMGSEQTPLGWHTVGKKIGEGAPWGQVFRARAATHEIWKPGGDTKEDLVLTRVFLLDGEEPGVNKGGNVDSRARYIYIHGTNDEARIGTPSSHGCVRMRNDDVIELFQILPEGAPVLITAE